MLERLYISNYALIQELEVAFHPNLNTVTGETGAGKSIILGALGLIMGNRADLSVLNNQEKKCVVEGHFRVGEYRLQELFEEHELDYDELSILRREISPAGKSRAFVNDTPVTLKTLQQIALRLVDIHSQHQNLELGNQLFQLDLVDTVAGAQEELRKYQHLYSDCRSLERDIRSLKEKAEQEKADLDYFQFQYNQLEEANLVDNEQEELEAELERLTHAEEIKTVFAEVSNALDGEEFAAIQQVKQCVKALGRVSNYLSEAGEMSERLESTLFELRDIADEAARQAEMVEFSPDRIEEVNQRLNLIYSLQQKHRVATVGELIALRDELERKIGEVVGYEDEIAEQEKRLVLLKAELTKAAEELTRVRKKAFKNIENSVIADLKQMGMPKTRFKVSHRQSEEFRPTGRDEILFLFSANADSEPKEISRIASGGEMSRLMLAIKNILRQSKALPTVIFDEIDTGVSGEIAMKMGNIIKSFSESTQIINITHLPQIAARGDAHFKVYKQERGGKTFTSIKQLTADERVEELAKMVGGDQLTESAVKIAEELLEIK